MKKNIKLTWNTIIIDYRNFIKEIFISKLMENLRLNSTYSILFKVSFTGNIFIMTGRQIGILVKDSHNIDYYINIYNILLDRIEKTMDSYNINEYPLTVSILIKEVKTSGDLEIKKLENINEQILKLKELNIAIKSKYLPLTLNLSYYGNLLENSIRNKRLKELEANIRNKSGLEVPLLIKKAIEDLTIKVFFKKDKGSISIILIESSKYTYKKSAFDLETGILLEEVTDIAYTGVIYEFMRIKKDLQITVKNDKIIGINRKIVFNSITNKLYKTGQEIISNKNFGVLDIETYKYNNEISKVYAIGYTTIQERSNIKTFYMSKNKESLDSNILVLECINSLLVQKYHNYIFYVHNLGRFDVVFIQKVLKEYNLHKKENYYIMKSLFRDDGMLKLVISLKITNKKYIKITLVDSLNLLNESLDNLGKSFNVSILKGKFPYDFVNEDKLFYIGDKPDIKFYKDITQEEYNLIQNKDWSVKEETLKYLEKDLLSLLEILEKFNKLLFIHHNLQMTEGLTISRIALNKFLNYYLECSKIPLINKSQHFNFINFGYYGGITEVYRPYGENLNYYDVNSLYPFVALQDMPGTECTYIENISNEDLYIKDLFGFFQAKVKTSLNNYLGLLPIKTKNGLILPNGEFEGVWSSEELKLAKENGYEIKIIKGYNFNRVSNVFTKYVNDLYKLKLESKGAEKAINKSLLNNLLGRFGMNIIKPKTECLTKDKLDTILSTREVKSYHEVTNNDYLVTYIPIINREICTEHGLDYVKVLTSEKNTNIEKNIDIFKDVSIVISAMVTSYARVFMNKIKLEILRNNGKLYYSDTDSIVTDIDLSTINTTLIEKLFKPFKLSNNLVGKDLGQFKLEYVIKEGYFISNKLYCLLLNNDKVVIKSKGVKQESLTLEDFKSMYYLSKNVIGNKLSSKINYKEGSVSINNKEINLDSEVYKKREKISNLNGLWTDTKPIIYNNITKSLVSNEKN
jgi:DNA polymerase type B, organellar and viral/RNase_H superfamily